MAATITIQIDGVPTPIVFQLTDVAVQALAAKVAASNGVYADPGDLLLGWYRPLLAQAVSAAPPADIAALQQQSSELQQRAAAAMADLVLVTRSS